MKKTLFSFPFLSGLLVAALGAPLAAQSQTAPAWQTAVAFGPSTAGTSTGVRATAADAQGNIYLVGTFSGTARFSSAITLTSVGGSDDVFVAKWSPTSGFLWAQRAGGAGQEIALGVAVSGASVYVTGQFGSASAAFGSTTLSLVGDQPDGFVAKLNDTGRSANFAWARRFGSSAPEPDYGVAIAVNGASVYVTGVVSGPATFGGRTLTPQAQNDMFVTKLTDAGSTASFIWVVRGGATRATPFDGNNSGLALGVSGANVYVAGNYGGKNARFGSLTLPDSGASDVFVAKLTDAGSSARYTWVKRAGGDAFDEVRSLAVSGTNVYVGGFITSPSASFGTTTLTSTDFSTAFLTKLVDAGSTSSFAWTQRLAGASSASGLANVYVAVNGSRVYVAGRFSGTTKVGGTTLTSAGEGDAYVARLTDAGTSSSVAWVQKAGGAANDGVRGVVVTGTKVVVAGTFASASAAFGTLRLTNTGDNTGFLASLTDAAPTHKALAAAAPRVLTGVDVYPNPASKAARVQLPASATLTLLDAVGRTVRTQAAPAGAEVVVPLDGLTPGLYRLRVQALDGRQALLPLAVE